MTLTALTKSREQQLKKNGEMQSKKGSLNRDQFSFLIKVRDIYLLYTIKKDIHG